MNPLGAKRICPDCNAKFYDLNHRPAQCPKCGHRFDPTVHAKPKRAKRTVGAQDDVLLQHMSKTKLPGKIKPVKGDDEEIGDEFNDLDAGDAGAEALEELDEIDDLEALEQLDDIEKPDGDDQIEEDLTREGAEDSAIIEETEEDDSGDEDEEPVRTPPKSKKK